jgi:hypothetical protein
MYGPSAQLFAYDPNDSTQFCQTWDIDTIYVTGAIGGGSCAASFVLFQDSVNPSNWFGYNLSSGTGNLTYFWDFGDGNTSTQQYPFHTYAASGNYVICLTITDANACSSSSCDSSAAFRLQQVSATIGQLNIINTSTGIVENNTIKNTSFYPNPVNDVANLTFTATENANATVAIINTLGQVFESKSTEVVKGLNTTLFNTSALSSGMYFITISIEGNKVQTIKFTK